MWRTHRPRFPVTCLALDANRALCSPSLDSATPTRPSDIKLYIVNGKPVVASECVAESLNNLCPKLLNAATLAAHEVVVGIAGDRLIVMVFFTEVDLGHEFVAFKQRQRPIHRRETDASVTRSR